MEVLDFDDHVGMFVPLENGLHAWLEAWADEPGGIRFMSYEGLHLVAASPAAQAILEEDATVEASAQYLAAAAEMLFASWRKDLIMVVKNSIPLPTERDD